MLSGTGGGAMWISDRADASGDADCDGPPRAAAAVVTGARRDTEMSRALSVPCAVNCESSRGIRTLGSSAAAAVFPSVGESSSAMLEVPSMARIVRCAGLRAGAAVGAACTGTEVERAPPLSKLAWRFRSSVPGPAAAPRRSAGRAARTSAKGAMRCAETDAVPSVTGESMLLNDGDRDGAKEMALGVGTSAGIIVSRGSIWSSIGYRWLSILPAGGTVRFSAPGSGWPMWISIAVWGAAAVGDNDDACGRRCTGDDDEGGGDDEDDGAGRCTGAVCDGDIIFFLRRGRADPAEPEPRPEPRAASSDSSELLS
jgi:hypothetical protein